jgi:threonine 3-dehydrogenase
VKAIAKVRPEPGIDTVEVDEPTLRPGTVKVKLEAASVCGTDLHIYQWDSWSASRIQPPRIIGHEFCGKVVEVASDVATHKVGDFVASESHVVCGRCWQCQQGQAHVCVNTRILGVDVDGGFAEYAVIPAQNARHTDLSIPTEVAAFQDALGNAVHTAMAGSVEGHRVLITGLGPIGLCAAAVCRKLGATKVYGTEVSPYRINLAEQMGLDAIINPKSQRIDEELDRLAPGGVDVTLEMSGQPSALDLAIRHTRLGGRVSLLGVYADSIQSIDLNMVIFKGLDLQGIVGRRLWETWDAMGTMLKEGMDVSPVITHRMHFTEFRDAMELMTAGKAGKVVFTFD